MAAPTYRQILVPLDGSPEAEGALPHAVALAARFGSSITLLQASDVPSSCWPGPVDALRFAVLERERAAEYLESVAQRWAARGFAARSLALTMGPPAEAILACARGIRADLIIMTTRGRSGLARLLLGSVAGAGPGLGGQVLGCAAVGHEQTDVLGGKAGVLEGDDRVARALAVAKEATTVS